MGRRINYKRKVVRERSMAEVYRYCVTFEPFTDGYSFIKRDNIRSLFDRFIDENKEECFCCDFDVWIQMKPWYNIVRIIITEHNYGDDDVKSKVPLRDILDYAIWYDYRLEYHDIFHFDGSKGSFEESFKSFFKDCYSNLISKINNQRKIMRSYFS